MEAVLFVRKYVKKVVLSGAWPARSRLKSQCMCKTRPEKGPRAYNPDSNPLGFKDDFKWDEVFPALMSATRG